MFRLTNLSNIYKKRTLRVLYGNTQATPYAATLSSAFVRTSGGQLSVTGSKACINPGSVAAKMAGEVVTLARSNSSDGVANRAFGLFAQFVGGELDELFDRSEVGIWRGVGSVYEVLAPAFDPTSGTLATAVAAEAGTTATEVYMNAASDGRLAYDSSATGTTAPLVSGHRAVVRCLDYLSANAIIVECLV